jgi:hypothetical protein
VDTPSEGLAVDEVIGKLSSHDFVDDEAGIDAVEVLESGKVVLVINTPRGRAPGPTAPTSPDRHRARDPCVTTSRPPSPRRPGCWRRSTNEVTVRSLQEYHRDDQLRLDV